MTNAPKKRRRSATWSAKTADAAARKRCAWKGQRWHVRSLPLLVYFCAMRTHALLDELDWRGLLYQNTEEVGDALSSGPISGYIGFDPTAPSLHIGNLLVIMLLVRPAAARTSSRRARGRRHGVDRRPERKDRRASAAPTSRRSTANAEAIRKQLERFLDFSGSNAARMMRQRRVARRSARRGIHARRRQALHDQLHAAEGFGEGAAWTAASPTPSSRTCCCRRTTFSSCAGATA